MTVSAGLAATIRHPPARLAAGLEPGCPSRHEPARSQGFGIPSDNFLNELARVCDSVGKSLVWRGLDVAFPSHFVMVGTAGQNNHYAIRRPPARPAAGLEPGRWRRNVAARRAGPESADRDSEAP